MPISVSQDLRIPTYPDNFFDVVVGNVPFGDYKVFDPKHNKYNFRIHDYFLQKST